MKLKILLDNSIRVVTGGLFIFSGLIKLNDPVGTEIKLEEYFEVFSSDFAEFFHLFIPYAMEIGMFLVILEVVLGVAVLLNFQMEVTTRILIGLIAFFTFLTFYSAYFNKVTDCGCFGDAIPLTPWQSFTKDIILVFLIMYLFWYRKNYESVVKLKTGNFIMALVAVFCLFAGIYAVRHLPYIDFRPYKVEDNIPDNMVPEEQPIFEYTFTKDGEKVKSIRYLLEKDGYELDGYEVINEDKTVPKITDYNVWSPELGDYTQQSFEGKKLFLIMVDVNYADTKSMDRITKMIEGMNKDIEPIMLTSSGPTVIEPFRHEYQLAMPYFFSDATVLKAMIRSNPGVMVLENGTVKGKWHYNDIPESEVVNKLF